MNWKHWAMLIAGGAAASAVWLSKADPNDAATWNAIAGGLGILATFFGLNSPAAFGKDAKS